MFDRGQCQVSEVQNRITGETQEIIDLQSKLGFEYISDGALEWQDSLRPLTKALSGVASGTRYSRWFDTNTFYQKPVVVGKIFSKDFDARTFLRTDLLPSTRRWKVTFPGPYTFAELSENKYYSMRSDLLRDIARAEKSIIENLGSSGVSLVQLSEPCLVYQPYREQPLADSELESALEAIRLAAEGVSPKVHLSTCFGNANPILPRLLELPVSAVGLDLYETELSLLKGETDKGLVLGIADARECGVEDPKWIAGIAANLAKQFYASEWILAPNTDLRYLPRETADQKALAIGEAARELAEGN